MTEIWRLYQLQKADLRVAEAEKAMAALRADEAHVLRHAETESAFQEADEELRRLKKELRDLEMEDKTLRERRKSLHDKLYGGRISNPKELASFETELEHVQARTDVLEDDMLLRMEDLEEREKTVAELRRAQEEELARRDARQRELDQEVARLESEAATSRQRRNRLAAETPPADLRLYETLRAKKHGVAVARVLSASCEGCRMHLTDHKIQEAKGAGTAYCSTCGRVLYVES